MDFVVENQKKFFAKIRCKPKLQRCHIDHKYISVIFNPRPSTGQLALFELRKF